MVALWLLLGLVGAAAYIAAGERVGGLAWWAVGLVVAALAYVAFAAARGAPPGEIAVEAVGAALYGGAVWVGWRRRSPRLLALAWALHPVWDVGVHAVGGLSAPAWYVWACLSFDLAVGAWLWRTPAAARTV